MSKHTFLRIVRAIARVVLGIIARIEIIGNVDYPTGGYIIAANHVGRLEAFLVILLADREDVVLILAEKYKKVCLLALRRQKGRRHLGQPV